MYLSRLELHGFKSFAQKTSVAFSPGVTAIVGPNGCGKSNVIDAVRWVLGEQRARLLRSEAMAGVIFNGAEGRRPLGMAEVSLTVENTRGVLPTEYAEVTVTRRLYRSGDSEYLLNGTPCRLRDVLDLFMDTGLGAGAYSVIELSMVEDILSENADDRRRLFEEAAGITKYKRRRAQALKRLDATRADLTRLDDIVDEVEKQVRSLARQAQKAARHEEWAARLRRLELALAAHDLARLDAERGALEATARERRAEAEGLGAQVSAGEARLESARADLVTREADMAEAARALAAHARAVGEVEAEVRVGDERRASRQRALDRIASERAADAARADAARAERAEAEGRAADADARLGETQAALRAAEAERAATAEAASAQRRAVESARQAVADARGARAAALAARDRGRDRRALLADERDRIAAGLSHDAPEADGDAAAALDAAEAASGAAAQRLDRAEAAAEAAREAAAAAEADRQRARAARDTAHAEADLLRALVESGAGADSATSFLAGTPGWRAPTVAETVGADEADRLALDAALGALAEAFVVQTDAEAEGAIGRLRQADAGRATFFVLDRLDDAGPASAPAPPGATPALDLVRSESRYDPLLRRLLQNVFVVGTLAEAPGVPGARFVTRDGGWTDARGAVHGGSPTPSASVVRFGARERQERAAAALADAEAALDRAEADAEAARERQAEAERDRAEAARLRDAAQRERDAARDADARQQARAAARAEAADRLRQRAAEVAAALDALPPDDALDADARDADARDAEADARLADATAAADAAERDRAGAEAAWSDARLAHARAQADAQAARDARDRAERTIEDVARRQAEHDAEEAQTRADAAHAEQADAERRARLDAERERTDALQTAARATETAVLEGRAAISDAEAETRAVRSRREAAAAAREAAERRLVEVTTRQETTLERLAEEHGATAADAAAELDWLEAEEPFQPETARAETPALRQKLRDLGAVNALALQDFEEAEGRLAFLREQRADLADAERSLLATIREINETARRRFDTTFAQVREAFQRLFADLFGGDAAADLALDGDDPLEAPVAITARPRGKRPVSLGQLSGGEKTLTATALLFAIYLVKPSPFCILDEVDAPLDDANVGRFMRLVRSFSDSTQFVLVTHNKLTMEAADRLYGVTMPTPGVSRLVSVRFDGGEAAGDGAAQPAAPPAAG